MPKRCLVKCQSISERKCITKKKCFYTNGKTRKQRQASRPRRPARGVGAGLNGGTSPSAPARQSSASVKEPSVKEPSVKEASVKEASVKEASVKEASVKEASVKEASTPSVRQSSASVKEASASARQSSTSVNYEPSANAKAERTQIAKQAAEKARKKTAVKTIVQFMRKTRHKRKAEFLKSICSDAGVCIAFGTNAANDIKKHFNGFTDFAYVKAPIIRIGSPSANGFINEINYQHRGYQAHAVLKSSMTADSDNLMYEYIVGNYINKQTKRFPCFVETYGLYLYEDPNVWTKMKDNKINNNISILKSMKQLQSTVNFELACQSSTYLAVLIQHLKGIENVWYKFTDPIFVSQELLYVLFQVYIPLSLIKDNFTHYDLYSMNVCLYTPVKGKYIEYHYHLGEKEVIFKSQYIAKIIDYGRSYFKDDTTKTNSKKIYDAVCKEPKCNETADKCGEYNGFKWLKKPKNVKESEEYFYVSSQKRNVSHDLRLLHDVLTYTNHGLRPYMMPLNYKTEYGTPELARSGLSKNIINNVEDAAEHFMREVTKPDAIIANEDYYSRGFTSLGELHIYDDGSPMRYVK
jgi:hypothetical protein